MPYTTHRIRTSTAVQRRARELRKEMTPSEQALWEYLRNRKLNGFKFRRQHPLGPYVADFYCAEHRLVIELDGGIHESQIERDTARTLQFESFGYRVLRFRNQEVEQNIDAVLEAILEVCR
jgi:very-short-patch-repair endonuclease